jgi:hypothetical protein
MDRGLFRRFSHSVTSLASVKWVAFLALWALNKLRSIFRLNNDRSVKVNWACIGPPVCRCRFHCLFDVALVGCQKTCKHVSSI